MKAYVLKNIGQFAMEEVPEPVPEENEVLVRVRAAGICGSDISRVYYSGTYSYPLIPGHEFAGDVVEQGHGADGAWLGKRVGVFPLIPCGRCRSCMERRYETCRGYSYLGSRRAGGFAEYVRVPEWNLLELPESITYEQAAMLEPMSVAVHAMRRAAQIQQRDIDRAGFLSGGAAANGLFMDRTVAVCGLGAIGLLLAMFLREAGVKRLFLIGNKPFQHKMVLDSGFSEDCYCDSRETDAGGWIREKTDGNGADVFFDCVGRPEVLELAAGYTASGGTVVLVGNPVSDMGLDRQTYWKLLRNQLVVTGTWNSSFCHEAGDDWHYVLDRVQSGRLHPEKLITQRFCMDELRQGFELMRDKSEGYVKVMGILS